ncbi:hypothetical protein PIB30_039091 [Stylosanthes scabra]|uniref:Uncharacterized protein n=1 Tax=Stylosanthes scabra TaxID=79078 RepID=A0ABU6YBJ3_9FABA|nr:hypothetical protein [Stylosanthes scabra]
MRRLDQTRPDMANPQAQGNRNQEMSSREPVIATETGKGKTREHPEFVVLRKLRQRVEASRLGFAAVGVSKPELVSKFQKRRRRQRLRERVCNLFRGLYARWTAERLSQKMVGGLGQGCRSSISRSMVS